MKECFDRSLTLNPLINKPYSFELLPPSKLHGVLEKIIKSGQLTEVGKDFFEDTQDLFYLRDLPHTVFAPSLFNARLAITSLLTETPGFIGYLTGGLEGVHLQWLIHGLLDDGIASYIFGIEEDTYVEAKGRTPLFTTQEKVSLWSKLAPDKSVIFVVPPKPKEISADDYCDWLAEYLGVLKNDRVIYIGSTDDSEEIKIAHQRRAATPNHVFNTSFGLPPLHTSEFLKKN